MKGRAADRVSAPRRLLEILTNPAATERDRALEETVRDIPDEQLQEEMEALEQHRHQADNLYEKVRALFFLYALHRFHWPLRSGCPEEGCIPFAGTSHLLARRFEEAIECFLQAMRTQGINQALCSALAAGYHGLAFQTLSDQVRRSVRAVKGNQWMFRLGHVDDHPLRWREELLAVNGEEDLYPVLRERTAVRMDLTHSAWSDIFFLGMDFPKGARVLNVSINLGVHGRDQEPVPPVEVFLRIIDEPVIRLTSLDLDASTDVTALDDIFDFARDYLGLLKAGVIAAGVVAPGMEGSGQDLRSVLTRLIGPGKGFELVSSVNAIPKGSRLAVSTNLLGGIIAILMRATGQTEKLEGPLREPERRIVAARAILGEWLGGSGGGWQDSGGVWPGIKLIEGVEAREGDLEYGISRGCLLPRHRVIDDDEISCEARQRLQDSLILVHGGMAQNVGPILEMVTEKYLLRASEEWAARHEALTVLDRILDALRQGDIRRLGAETTRNFRGPLQTIIPWATNLFTERVIEAMEKAFGDDFWGFWMLGGMSGGGMGFIVDPRRKAEGQTFLRTTMSRIKAELEHALPFAMEPVVYDFSINHEGTRADLLKGNFLPYPESYYTRNIPLLLRYEPRQLRPRQREELRRFGQFCRDNPRLQYRLPELFSQLLPGWQKQAATTPDLGALLAEHGFDAKQHEQIARDYRNGRIGVAQNRLSQAVSVDNVRPSDVVSRAEWNRETFRRAGEEALANGEVAVVTLAAGVGSRWSQGAGVVKALHPFARLGGKHRTFLETHLAKSRARSRAARTVLPHLFTTSYLTHRPIADHLQRIGSYQYPGTVWLSPGRSIGLRMIPTARDLRFCWEEMAEQVLDEQKEKMRESVRAAWLAWVQKSGEGTPYTDNLPGQCLHPVGHWYEIPNLLKNGILARLWQEHPRLRYLMMHNIDTLGADVDPALLGWFRQAGQTLAFEVIPRQLDDRGGGLARVGETVRLVEGLAMPSEEEEWKLSYYNTNTCWIDLEALLRRARLKREDLADQEKVNEAMRELARQIPTYVTIKEVKKRWGHGQEDIFPVAQFEKLWGDMTLLADCPCAFPVVPRERGQQLKDQAQLDGWLRDGSAAHVESLGDWSTGPATS